MGVLDFDCSKTNTLCAHTYSKSAQKNLVYVCSMNYLAHAYLSFGQAEILVGNMISDFVKGKSRFLYPVSIQKGISLHREIDAFTDHHEATQKVKQVFRPAYRLYSAAFADIVYDHFLANDKNEFPEGELLRFSEWVYQTLHEYYELFPTMFKQLFPYMRRENWLYGYRLNTGIEKSFAGLVRRASYMHESDTAYQLFKENYALFEECYKEFFPELKKFTAERII
jgi:acyl carrier protein phosphodiesterase